MGRNLTIAFGVNSPTKMMMTVDISDSSSTDQVPVPSRSPHISASA